MTHTILTFIFTEIHVHACPQTCALCRNILLNRMDTQHACVLYRRPVICAGADGRRSEYSTSHFQNVLNFRFNLRDYTDAICDSLVLFFFCLYARGFIVHLSKTAAYWWEHCRPFSASILVAGLYHSRTARHYASSHFSRPFVSSLLPAAVLERKVAHPWCCDVVRHVSLVSYWCYWLWAYGAGALLPEHAHACTEPPRRWALVLAC